MRTRRWIGFFISIILVIQAFLCNIISAEEISQEGITVLEKLNIISAEEIENTDENDVVTRVDFAVYAAKALFIKPINNQVYFKDVPVTHWANGYISALVLSGVIDLSEDGNFYPNAAVTPEQAYKIMLAGQGYKKFAMAEGESMFAYVKVARNAKIAIQTKNTDSLTMAEAAEIIYKSMDIGLARVSSIGENGSESFTVFENDTLLNAHKVHKASGIVSAVYGISAKRGIVVENENQAYIDDEVYTIDSSVRLEPYFGQKIEFVYTEDKDSKKVVIYASHLGGTSLKIKSDMLRKYDSDSRQIVYYKNKNDNKISSVSVPTNIRIVFNGKVYDGRLSDLFDPFFDNTRKGEITLVKSNESEYDLVVVKSYRTVVVKSYNSNTGKVVDYYSGENNIELSEYELVKYVNEDGIKAKMPGDFPAVLEVAESVDGETAEIIVCSSKVKGTVDAKYDSNKTIVLNNEKYIVGDNLWQAFEQHLNPGDNIVALLDGFNKIVHIDILSGDDMKIGYITDVACEKKVFNNTKIKIKIYTDEELKILEFADKIRLDGVLYDAENYRDLFLAFPLVEHIRVDSVKIKPQIIRFKMNAENQIVQIDSMKIGPGEDKKNSLVRKHDGTNELIYNTGSQRFGLDVLYNASRTKVFVVPQTDDNGMVQLNDTKVVPNQKMYSSSFTFEMDKNYTIESYKFDYSNPFTDIIVVHKKPISDVYATYMFDSFETILDNDGECAKVMVCYTQGGEVSFEIDKTLENSIPELKQGDIVKVSMGMSGETIVAISKLFDHTTMTFNNGGKNAYWYDGTFNPLGGWNYRDAKWQLTKTYVYDVLQTVVNSAYEPSSLQNGEISESINVANLSIVVYDSEITRGNKIYMGTINDIDTYVNSGFDCSVMLVSRGGATYKNIYIYK